MTRIIFVIGVSFFISSANAQWQPVYRQTFEKLPNGARTGSKTLPQWESGSADGVVYDGNVKDVGKFLVASSAWTSFNQGPIFNLDLGPHPHDKVRVSFDLYTFGEWRGIQQATGGPQHRLMFFDNKASPAFAFDTCFATNPNFQQAWPDRNPAKNKSGTGATPIKVDSKGRFKNANLWKIQFEYPSNSPNLRFAILCGAAAGSGRPMPHFGIDNLKVSVHSTAPTIVLDDRISEIQTVNAAKNVDAGTPIEFLLKEAGRISLGVFDVQAEKENDGRLIRTLLSSEALSAGRHRFFWDGLDNQGKPVASGQYQWRLVETPGLKARYITTIGVNPPGGENPIPSKSWVGDHLGAGLVDVDSTGVYIGSPMTEGGRMILKADPSMSKVLWSRPQFYQSGRLTKIATNGNHVFMIHPNGKLRRLNKDNGKVEAEWQMGIDGAVPDDLDATNKNVVVVYSSSGKVRLISVKTGKVISEFTLKNVSKVAAKMNGEVIASAGKDLYRIDSKARIKKVASLSGTITGMDFDPQWNELWVVIENHKIERLGPNFKVNKTYGGTPRPWGPYDPNLFAGIQDIAADRKGGFYIGEPSRAPRRIAHVARSGSVTREWFGGMSFYINGSFDPEVPTRFFGIAPEGAVNVYRIDFENGTWQIEACYSTGRLGDSVFPFSGSFRVIKRNGDTYLFHRQIPSVIRLDPDLRRAVPVAYAGTVRNRGRSLIQFSGSGRDGYPQPWVAAAEFHGFKDLAKAPRFFSWADSNGDGKLDPQEFRFYPGIEKSHAGGGDYFSNGDYLGSGGLNSTTAFVRLPVSSWEGPRKDAPRWDFSKQESLGKIPVESHGFGSIRNVCVGEIGSITATYQAGVMIREHGQFEGGGWPECAVKGCRVLRFDSQLQPRFAVGRQSKVGAEKNSGVLYYPMHAANGPNHSVVINDQTKQPAQVWTDDGLYVGGMFDRRANDGLPSAFYQVHGDDNQGCTLVTTENQKSYWLSPYQGHNRLYEISGWNNWKRQKGLINLSASREPSMQGTGLLARYFKENSVVLETVEPPIYFERFGPERHSGSVKPHYKVEWTGVIVPPVTDRFNFHSLIGEDEQFAIWIDGRLIQANGMGDAKNVFKPVDLTAGQRHRVRIEYINPEGRAELKLLWSSRILDHQRVPVSYFFPDRKP